tara:strand:+ start:227 stop:826 length:600 start_codon:yes stop_codon:yes gene_type:complete
MAIGTTKLQAVNTMLSVIGESSTNTLTGTVPFEVSLAEDILDEVIKELCQDSYVFNTELDITVIPDVSNHLIAQSHWVRVQAADSETDEYVLREITPGSGSYLLYSMTDKTNEFTSSVSVNIVYLLEFANLPEAAKRYCTIRAARVYADRLVGSKDIRAFSQVDELEARAKLLNYEVGVDKLNVLRDNSHARNLINRRI